MKSVQHYIIAPKTQQDVEIVQMDLEMNVKETRIVAGKENVRIKNVLSVAKNHTGVLEIMIALTTNVE